MEKFDLRGTVREQKEAKGSENPNIIRRKIEEKRPGRRRRRRRSEMFGCLQSCNDIKM